MRSTDRIHSPHSAGGTSDRIKPQGGMNPGGIRSSWPGKSSFNPTGTYRRKAKRRNADCVTDAKPHRALSRAWIRDGMTVAQAQRLVRTKHSGDALYQRALAIFEQMMATLPARLVVEQEPAAATVFPMGRFDLVGTVRTCSWLHGVAGNSFTYDNEADDDDDAQ